MTDAPGDMKGQRDRFIGFAFAAADLLLEMDAAASITYAAGAGRGLTDRAAERLIGSSLYELIDPADHEFVQVVSRRVKPGTRMDPVPVRFKGAGGQAKKAVISGFSLPGQAARFYLAVSLADRMPNTREAPEARDTKTGLLTKQAFIESAKRRTKGRETAEADSEEQLSFLFIQGIEKLREEQGEDAVERFLEKLSARLRANAIGGDSVGLLGDGKLGVLHDTGIDQQTLQAEAAKVAAEMNAEGAAISVDTFAVDLQVPGMSEADASKAMVYAVQRFSEAVEGEFKVSSLTEGAQDLLKDTLKRVATLRETISSRAFSIAYQPIIDLSFRTVHHFEALTRFEGTKSPAQMIAFAEEVGLIEDFDLLMTQRVLEGLVEVGSVADWTPIVAVNLSARSMQSDVFVRSLAKVVEPFRHIREQLYFEITETASVRDFERFNNVIQALRKGGHHVCLDDVGSGSTSFQSLDLLQVDMVKIDGEYIQGAAKNPRQLSMLKSIVALCNDLDIVMVAEMIDNERQVKDLKNLGVQYGQGYLFGRPTTDFREDAFNIKPGAVDKRRGETVQWS